MASQSTGRQTFTVTHESEPAERLIGGFSAFGLAGLTAVDYLVDHLELTERGHISTDAIPAITPFENGTPRHHTRLYSRDDLELTVLVNELFVPGRAADPFAKAILDWTDQNTVQEVTVLSGVPVPHGPEDHRVFYVATEDYQDATLNGLDVPPMGNGFLDGVNASLLQRGMDSSLRAGVFVTPVHEQVPDVEAALRLIEAVDDLYDLDVDTTDLEQFAGEVQQYYRSLEERLEAVEQAEAPEDRMYM